MTASIQLKTFSAPVTLRAQAREETKPRRRKRLLAMADVLDGMRCAEAAKRAGINSQSLQIWIERYNQFGDAGLVDQPRSGRPRLLTDEQRAELEQIISRGFCSNTGQTKRWTAKALCCLVAEKFGVRYTIGGMAQLKRALLLGLRRAAMVTSTQRIDRPSQPDH